MAAGDPWQDLLDDARAQEAGAARGRERWLRQAAAEDATLAGVLLDLAEARAEATVQSSSGRAHRGRVVLVGSDVVAVETSPGPLALVALRSVVSVCPEAGPGPVGSRPAPEGPGLLDLLATAAADDEIVLLTGPSGATVRGVLAGVGADVVALRPEDGRGLTTYVSADSICEVLVLRSG